MSEHTTDPIREGTRIYRGAKGDREKGKRVEAKQGGTNGEGGEVFVVEVNVDCRWWHYIGVGTR